MSQRYLHHCFSDGGLVSDIASGSSYATAAPLQSERKRKDDAASREYSARLAALAAFTVRHKALVIGAWMAVAVVLALLFPQLETVVRQQSVELIPHDVASFQTVDRMSAAFGEQGSKTMLFVAMEDSAGLTPQTRQRYDELVKRLRSDTHHVRLVQDLLADHVTADLAVTKDGHAGLLPVGVPGTLGAPTAAESSHAVSQIAGEVFNGSTTTVRVTGP